MRRQTYLVSSSGVHSDGTLTPRPHHNANEHDTRRKLADSAASNCAHLPALASNLQCLLPPLPVVLARRGLLLLAPRAIPKTTSGKLKRAECKQCYARYAEALLRSDVAASRTGVSEGGAVRSDAAAALRPSIDAAALIHAWRSSGDESAEEPLAALAQSMPQDHGMPEAEASQREAAEAAEAEAAAEVAEVASVGSEAAASMAAVSEAAVSAKMDDFSDGGDDNYGGNLSVAHVAKVIKEMSFTTISPDEPLDECGLDSLEMYDLEEKLRELTGIKRLPISFILEHATLRELCRALRAKVAEEKLKMKKATGP